MRVMTTEYREQADLSVKIIERYAGGELGHNLEELANGFIDGSIKPTRVIKLSQYRPDDHLILERRLVGMKEKKPKQRKYENVPRAPERRDILVVRLCERDEMGRERDEMGDRIEPVVRMVLVDGTKLEFGRGCGFEPSRIAEEIVAAPDGPKTEPAATAGGADDSKGATDGKDSETKVPEGFRNTARGLQKIPDGQKSKDDKTPKDAAAK